MTKRATFSSILLFIICLICIFLSIFFKNGDAIPLEFHNGYADLSRYGYDNNCLYTLDRDWLLSYKGNRHEVPASFSEQLEKKNTNEMIFRMKVRVPQINRTYGIIMPKIGSDYSLMVNGEKLFENGIYAGKSSQIRHINVHYIYVNTREIEITIKCMPDLNSKQSSRKIVFGSSSQIQNRYYLLLSFDIAFIAIMFTSFIYFFSVSFAKENTKQYLSFSFLCLAGMIRASLINSAILGVFFPSIPIRLSNSLSYMISPILTFIVLYYVHSLFPYFMPPGLYRFTLLISLMYTITICFLPNDIMPYMFVLYVIIIILSCICIVCADYYCIKNRTHGYMLFTFSVITLILSTSIETIPINIHKSYGYSLSLGLVFFAVVQTIYFLINAETKLNIETELSDKYNKALKDMRLEETNYLSSHLKPHFLFNALNIISGYALFEPAIAKETTKALKIYLNQLFEHDNLNEMNTLENEISLARAFGFIEKQRFPEIDIEYDINYINGNTRIPALILQPLLENAINHGIRQLRFPQGLVLLSVYERNNFLYFTIFDDGVGVTEEKIQLALSKPNDNKFHSLYHLQLRLQNLYNEKVSIKSSPSEGTEISFKIPV